MVDGVGHRGILDLAMGSRELRTSANRSEAAGHGPDFGRWTSLGPSTFVFGSGASSFWVTGRVSAVAADPGDPNHWLVGGAEGGVWDTHDAGATWRPRADEQPSLAIGAIAFSPTSPNVVYAGTGEANNAWTYAGAGMLRSTDSGATWSVVNTGSFARASVKAILVHPADPNIVVAGTARGRAGRDLGAVVPPPIFGIQRSTDGGANWTRLLTGEVTDLVRHPDDFSRQYAAVAFSDANGLYRTSDMGDRWTPVAGPWRPGGYMALAVAPSNPEVMYASVQSPESPNARLLGLFRTNNAWAATPEWIQIPIDVQTQSEEGPVAGYCQQCSYAHIISVDPAEPDTVFVGGRELWQCRSCAASPTWLPAAPFVSKSLAYVDYHGLTWAGNRLIAVNDGGVFSSIDRGVTWRSHNVGLPLLQMYSGAVHATGDMILANTQDQTLAIKRTGSGTWERLGAAADVSVGEGQVVISSRHPDTDFATTGTFRHVGRSIDGGRSFQAVEGNIDLTTGEFQMALAKCPADDDVVFVGNARLWRTNNFFNSAAPTWSSNSPTIPGSIPGCTGCKGVRTIAFPGSDSCNSYAFGGGDGVLRITTNGGASWSDLDPSRGVPARAVTGLRFAPSDSNVAYVTLSGFDEGTPGRPGHVFKSTNALSGSAAWTDVSPPANIPFNVVAIDPTTPNTLFVGADNGVWASNDGGATWAYLGIDAGLPGVAVFDLQIQASTRKVFAFTFGRGAFVLTRQ
jgi:photosystem II stability/assembly factor-like uncharacterized protein